MELIYPTNKKWGGEREGLEKEEKKSFPKYIIPSVGKFCLILRISRFVTFLKNWAQTT